MNISIAHISWSLRDSKKQTIRGTEGYMDSTSGQNLLQVAIDKHKQNKDLTLFIQMSEASAEAIKENLQKNGMDLYGPYTNKAGKAYILGNTQRVKAPEAVVDLTSIQW
jgi:hypothetical protein